MTVIRKPLLLVLHKGQGFYVFSYGTKSSMNKNDPFVPYGVAGAESVLPLSGEAGLFWDRLVCVSGELEALESACFVSGSPVKFRLRVTFAS